MRTLFIAGNWKMNKTAAEAVAFLSEIKDDLNAINGIDIAVCPPALAIPAVADLLKDTKIGVGAQNMYFEESGAYTGELAPNMLTPFCNYVILGHSERRQYFGETDEGVNKKIKAALAHGLTPIVCCGESLEQNQAGKTHAFVSGQIKGAFAGFTGEEVASCVIAYEPIWAIGTGLTATVEQAGSIVGDTVRATIKEMFGDDVAQKIRIQYGGSVNEKNSAELMGHPEIDGALVGGASMKPAFVDLIKNAQ
ncbi:MAG: triose-phosphate isomerase [Aquificales bacterium]|nr:triose-phosphate isomerase [Aquificales bacterium]